MRTTLVITAASLLLGASAVQAKGDGLEEAYFDAIECRVAAHVVQSLLRADLIPENKAEMLVKTERVEGAFADASRWVGSKIGKDAMQVKADFTKNLSSFGRIIMEGEITSSDYVKTVISCAEAIQEAES